MTLYGKVIDSETNAPLPGATVTLRNGTVMLTNAIASSEGVFYLNTSQYPDALSITHVGYEPQTWPLPANEAKTIFSLKKVYTDLEPVTVTSKKSLSWLLWAGLITLFIRENKKKLQ